MSRLPHGESITAASLKSREAWKYARIKQHLEARGVRHEFEIVVGDAIFDLGLIDQKLLVEFDGSGHRWGRDGVRDGEKEAIAAKNGWGVLRVPVTPNDVIPETAIARAERCCK